MVKLLHKAAFFILVFSYFSCSNNIVAIEPINTELNQQLLTGNGLDPNLFSRKEITQYYQIDNYEQLTSAKLEGELNEYVSGNYTLKQIATFRQVNIIFYQKKLFKNYNNHLYTLVQDSDSGFISNYKNDLVGVVSFEKLKGKRGKLLRKTRIIQNSENTFQRTDTITIHP